MRAKEFIVERSFSKRKSGPMSTTFQFPSMPSSHETDATAIASPVARAKRNRYGV